METNPQNHEAAPTPSPAPAAAGWWSGPAGEWLIAAGLLGVTLLTYQPVLKCDFVNYDDPAFVLWNPSLRLGFSLAGLRWAFTTVLSMNWHPLTLISFLVDYQLFGLKPWGYHLTNLLLHLANTLLLFRCLRVLTGAVGRSACVAALFALHPLHVESVAWVADRNDLLSTLFALLALRAYAWYAERPRPARMAVVAALLTLSLLAKSIWVTFPFLLLLLDYWPLRRPLRWWRLVVEKWPLFGLAVAACCFNLATRVWQPATLTDAAQLPFLFRLGNALVSYVEYLRQLALPNDLAVFYPHPGLGLSAGQVAVAVLLLGAVTALACSLVRSVPYLFVGWCWYVGMLVPMIGLVQVGEQGHADRYTYVPLTGIFLFLTWGAADLFRRAARPQLAPLLAGAVLVLCAVDTRLQIACWKDSLSLWAQAARVTRDNLIVHRNYGSCLEEKGRFGDALRHYTLALKAAPGDGDALQGSGRVLLALQREEEAGEMFQAALRVEPQPYLHYYLAVVQLHQGRLEEAAGNLEASIAGDPTKAQAWHSLGIVRLRQQKYGEAEECFERAIRLVPASAEFHLLRGTALLRLSRPGEAVPVLSEAVRLAPDLLEAHQLLADALANAGRFPEAVAAIDRALAVAERASAGVDPARQAAFIRSLEERRQSYEQGRPYRME
jgi:protein O-mannosyl-transferase